MDIEKRYFWAHRFNQLKLYDRLWRCGSALAMRFVWTRPHFFFVWRDFFWLFAHFQRQQSEYLIWLLLIVSWRIIMCSLGWRALLVRLWSLDRCQNCLLAHKTKKKRHNILRFDIYYNISSNFELPSSHWRCQWCVFTVHVCDCCSVLWLCDYSHKIQLEYLS